jgi:hypothetical protein
MGSYAQTPFQASSSKLFWLKATSSIHIHYACIGGKWKGYPIVGGFSVRPLSIRTIFAATFAHRLPPGAYSIQVPAPQHVDVTHLDPAPHCDELVHEAPQLCDT